MPQTRYWAHQRTLQVVEKMPKKQGKVYTWHGLGFRSSNKALGLLHECDLTFHTHKLYTRCGKKALLQSAATNHNTEHKSTKVHRKHHICGKSLARCVQPLLGVVENGQNRCRVTVVYFASSKLGALGPIVKPLGTKTHPLPVKKCCLDLHVF
jgi:hypothetical protein